MLDLRQFYVLRAIAEEGSLAAAARRLHYGQPTISHHLAALESHLGTTLVERGPRGAELTELGLLFMGHLDPILDQLRAAEDDLANRVAHGLSTLRVGTFPTAGARMLPTALRKVIPGSGVSVELVEAEPLDLLERLRDRSLHCALIYDVSDASPTDRPDLAITTLLVEPYRLILAADHPLADQPVIDLRDLRDEGWILARDAYDPGDRGLLAAYERLGFRPRVALRSDDYGVIQGFVAAGTGVALVPEMAIDPGAAVRVRPTVQDVGARSIHFATLAGTRAPVVEALASALCEQRDAYKVRTTAKNKTGRTR